MEFLETITTMKYNCANQRLRRSAAMLTILIGISFQFGCSSRSEKHLREDKVFNRFLQEIKKTPKPALQKLSDIFKEKPNLEILGNVEQEFFDTYTTFTIAGSKTNMRSKKIDGLNFKNNKYMGEIKYNQVKDIKEFRKELILNNAKATADFNLLLCDDFLPLLPKEMNLLNQDLSHGILMDKRMSLNRFSENRARLESPISTSNNQFLKSTFFFSPMGYTKNKESRRRIGNKKTNLDNWTETAPVIPISVQRLVIAYNQVAWESYHHLRRLEKPVEGELSSPMEPPVIEELHFNDFIEYLERWDMRMLYPDPESSDPKVRNLGIAFICQLMSWIENRYYQIFLTNPESPLIVDAVRSIKKFLSAKRAVLLPSNSLDQMLQAALSENILDSPPSNFKFPNFLEVKDLPEKFKLDEVENRMTFAYIPETVFVEAMAKYNFQTLNNEVLTEYRKRKDEKQRLKELKKLRKKRRRERRKKKNAGSTSKASDESTTEKKLQKDTIQAKVEISLNSSMLAIFQLKEHIGLREYVAIPNNGLKKKEALSFAVSLLQKNIQNAISRNLLNKKGGLKLTKARRPIRMDTQPVVWIPKEFLRPKTGKGFKPPREFFETSVYNTQSEAQKTFIPVLNYYYQRAIMALWSKKRF
tara:strand:+ start:853 stop:2781 length:1929 start_codon:yes stop_codon:yes gene_type:complete